MVYFQNKNANLGKFRLAKKDVGKFYGYFVYFTAIWYILWPFGIFSGHFGIFFPVLVCCTKKNLATPENTLKTPPNQVETLTG
jgi:hypothetical protein